MLHELAIDKLKFFFGHNQGSAKKKPIPTTTGLASIHFLFPCSLLQAKLLDPNSCESGHAAEHLLSLAIGLSVSALQPLPHIAAHILAYTGHEA